MDPDLELLRQYANNGSQRAFSDLVERTAGFVYAAALRQTGGDAHLAQDVTQAVYLTLAFRAGSLKRHAVLAGWLHTSTRFLAMKARRTQMRWQRREREANLMMTSRDTDPAWNQLRPLIDDALHELDEKDRTVLLLRFFNGKSHANIGQLVGLSENAARMRVERALEKLRVRLAPRGITSTAAALGAALASQSAVAVPASVVLAANSVSAVALASATTTTFAVLTFMSTTKVVGVTLALVVAAGIGGFQIAQSAMRPQLEESTVRLSSQAVSMAALERDNQSLRRELKERLHVSPPASPTKDVKHEETLRVLTELGSSGIIRAGLGIVEVEGTISPLWAEAIGLKPIESARLAAAVATARQQLGRHDLANSGAEIQPDGRLIITVQPYPEGAAIYDELLGTFRATLGPERFQVFARFGLEGLEDNLTQLGLGKKILTLKHDRSLAGERNEYQMTVRIERANGTVKQGVATDRHIGGLIAHMIGPLTAHVPPGF